MNAILCSFVRGTVIELSETDKTKAIHQLIQEVSTFHSIDEPGKFEKAVLAREKDQCTGFGKGVAVAHAAYNGLSTILIGLGISRKGIDYHAFDGEPVKLLFLIASPENMKNEYLHTLSALVKLLRRDEFRKELLSSKNIRQARKYLNARFCQQMEQENEPVRITNSCS